MYIIQVVQESPTQVMNIKISPRLSGRNKYKTLLGGYFHNPAFMGLSEKKTHPCWRYVQTTKIIITMNAQGNKSPWELTQ